MHVLECMTIITTNYYVRMTFAYIIDGIMNEKVQLFIFSESGMSELYFGCYAYAH